MASNAVYVPLHDAFVLCDRNMSNINMKLNHNEISHIQMTKSLT